MYFLIVQKIDYLGGEWLDYVSWRNCSFTAYESIDCHVNKILFKPITKEDWRNVHQEDCKTHLIDNVAYAIKVNKRIPNSRIQVFFFYRSRAIFHCWVTIYWMATTRILC